MNHSVLDAVDLERATDQFVDEICQRLTALHACVNTSLAEVGPPIDDIRRHASALVDRLSQPDPVTAIAVACTLWPPQPGAHVPASWWATPLGRLIASALDGPAAQSSTGQRSGHG
jgi:hypothetical protein